MKHNLYALIGTAYFAIAATAAPTYLCDTGATTAVIIGRVQLIVVPKLNSSNFQMKIVVPPESYVADLTQSQVEALTQNQPITLVGTSTKSEKFGGGTSHSVVLNLQINQKDDSETRTILAEKGDVIRLACKKAEEAF